MPSVQLKKITGGGWALQVDECGAPDEDFRADEAEAYNLVARYQSCANGQDTQMSKKTSFN